MAEIILFLIILMHLTPVFVPFLMILFIAINHFSGDKFL